MNTLELVAEIAKEQFSKLKSTNSTSESFIIIAASQVTVDDNYLEKSLCNRVCCDFQ